MKRLKAKLKKHWKEVMRLKTSNHEIALGFAVGSFLVILPTPGFSIILGFIAILLYKKMSKISLFFAFAFWNPIMMIPVYSAAYAIGNMIFSQIPVVEFDIVILNQIYLFTRRFAVGLCILAVAVGVGSYPLVRYIIYLVKNKKILK